MLAYIMVFCAVFVVLKKFTEHMDGWVQWLPTPPHPRVLMGCAHDVQEVRGHVKAWKRSRLGSLTTEIAIVRFLDRIPSQLNDIPSFVQYYIKGIYDKENWDALGSTYSRHNMATRY